MTITDIQGKALATGFLEQINRDKDKQPITTEVIIRVTLRGDNPSHGIPLMQQIAGRSRDVISIEPLAAVIDKTKYQDALDYIAELESRLNDNIITKAETALEAVSLEPLHYWTRDDMAKHFGVSNSTIGRWLAKQPIATAFKTRGQWQIPADSARNYTPPPKRKAGRKRKS